MKKKNIKLISYILCFIFTMSISFAYASGDGAEEVIKNVSNSILNVLTWFAYAIAMGALLFIGIKYLTSSANEKANLKNIMPTFLIGIALIVCCFTIAKAVASIAGNETAEDIIQVGEQFGVVFGEKTDEETVDKLECKHKEVGYTLQAGNYVYYCTSCGTILRENDVPKDSEIINDDDKNKKNESTSPKFPEDIEVKNAISSWQEEATYEERLCGAYEEPTDHAFVYRTDESDPYNLECVACGKTLDVSNYVRDIDN